MQVQTCRCTAGSIRPFGPAVRGRLARSAMPPCSSTIMALELRTVESRWAMTKTVRPSIRRSIPSMRASVRVSMLEVASSKISTGGSATASAGNGQQLALALAQVGTIARYHGVVPLGQALDKGVRVGNFCGGDDLFVGCIQFAKADVIRHCAGEQMGVLQHHARERRRSLLRILRTSMPS